MRQVPPRRYRRSTCVVSRTTVVAPVEVTPFPVDEPETVPVSRVTVAPAVAATPAPFPEKFELVAVTLASAFAVKAIGQLMILNPSVTTLVAPAVASATRPTAGLAVPVPAQFRIFVFLIKTVVDPLMLGVALTATLNWSKRENPQCGRWRHSSIQNISRGPCQALRNRDPEGSRFRRLR